MIFKKSDTSKTTSDHTAKSKYGGKTKFVIALLLCLICLIFFCERDKSSQSKEAGRNNIPPPPQRSESPAPQIVIQRILLQPSQPTIRDTINAEIFLSESAKASGKQFQYVYAWQVNDQHISYASGDTLQLSDFSIGDWVRVTITPYDEGVASSTKTSPSLQIHAVPPSLDLHLTQGRFTTEKPFECQLISKHPDSETVTFSLEEPKIEGMTINTETGRITWSIPTAPQKALQFGASVIDPMGNKTTRIFTLGVNPDSSTPANTD